MLEYGRPRSKRQSNFHIRNQQPMSEPADQQVPRPSLKITYDMNERIINLQKQQNYKRMLDEQVNDKHRLMMANSSQDYSQNRYYQQQSERDQPITTFADTIPYSPYSKESTDVQFKRQMELNREKQVQEMNQIRRDITQQLQSVKVYDFSSIADQEKLGFSRYYSQQQRPRQSRHFPQTIKRNDSGRIEACLQQCEAILNGFVNEPYNNYLNSHRKYDTVEKETNVRRNRRVHTETVGNGSAHNSFKQDSINPNLLRLPELPIKKRLLNNADMSYQLNYPKRTNIFGDDKYSKAKQAVNKSRQLGTEDKQHHRPQLTINSEGNQSLKQKEALTRQRITSLIDKRNDELKGSSSERQNESNEEELSERNEFLIVKPVEILQQNIQALVQMEKQQSSNKGKYAETSKPKDKNIQPKTRNSEADIRVLDKPKQQVQQKHTETQQPIKLTLPVIQQSSINGKFDLPVINKNTKLNLGRESQTNNKSIKLLEVPTTPRTQSRLANINNNPDAQSEPPLVHQQEGVEKISLTQFTSLGGDTNSTNMLQNSDINSKTQEEDATNVKGKDIVSYLMRVKARGSKLFQRIKQHKETLKRVKKLTHLESDTS